MTVSGSRLTRVAGVLAALSGALYILVQPIHPAEDAAAVTGGAWVAVGWLTMIMAVSGLVGIVGIYLRQVRESGPTGLAGVVLFGTFYLLTWAFAFAETLVMPPLAAEAPLFVDGFLGIFSGAGTQVGLGVLPVLGPVAALLYVLGGVLFGLAIFRARVLDRRAGLLLVAGALSTLLVPLLPHAAGRYAAVPVGLAMIWLGYSLWSVERGPATDHGEPRLDTPATT